jgi:predicted TPR repeat methyltransferase
MTSPPPPDKDMLAALRVFQPGDSTEAHYDAWAGSYDRDLVDSYGYSAHVAGASAFAEANADRRISVIDVGCGTGLVGVELRRHGFTVIDGLDVSRDMMAKAAEKNIYRQLIPGNLMSGTSIADGAYDAAICVGAFGPGHLGPAALGRIIRMVSSGGCIVIFMNAAPYAAEDYETHINRLAHEGAWVVEAIETMNYMSQLDRPGKLIRAHRA